MPASSIAKTAGNNSQRGPLIHLSFGVKVLIGLAVGIVLGAVARIAHLEWLATTLSTVGSVFVTLLRAVVVPLVLFALIVSVWNLRKVANAAKLAVSTLVWFAITSAIAVTIGLVIGIIANPGRHAAVNTSGARAVDTTGSWLDFLKSIVPGNALGATVTNSVSGSGGSLTVTGTVGFNVLQVVVIGIALGAAALAVGQKATPFVDFSASALEIFQKITWWVILLSPIGSAGLIGKAIASYGWGLVRPLGVFTISVYLGCLLVLFGVYPALLALHGLPPRHFFAGAWPAIQLAFVSRSSVGTLPVTERNAIALGVPREYVSFAVPIGATTKMDGCAAIYPALAAITVAQLFGIHLAWSDYLLIAFVSIVGSAATAGLTGAFVMLTLTLSTIGLPLEGAGLLLAIDPILDMVRTATNVAGQIVVPLIVSKRAAILDQAAYEADRSLGANAGFPGSADEAVPV